MYNFWKKGQDLTRTTVQSGYEKYPECDSSNNMEVAGEGDQL